MATVAQLDRRMLAILAADVVGYSGLMEADEPGTIARLQAVRTEVVDPLVASHHGWLVKLMGDGALVAFESVVDAVTCAVGLQRTMAARNAGLSEGERIVFRVGVNLGDVALVDEDVYGDGVNVAARLEQLCDPGGVVVSGTAYDQLHGKLDLVLDFAGEQRFKNIARPVRAYRARLDGSTQRRQPLMAGWLRRRLLPVTAAALLLALPLAAGAFWWLWPGDPSPAGKPAIAVLPFDNLGGDDATGRLADGITEDIITDLARFRDLDVIARNSTALYKGKPVDIRQVGKDLGVGYVLEGSIQRQADHVRVSAQLIDARTGAHAWSERWDRPAQDVFAVQTEVAEQVASTLGGYGLLLDESRAAAKRKRPADLEAYDLWTLEYEAFLRGTKADLEQALVYADAAIAKDPSLVRAYTKKAWILINLAKYRDNWNEVWAEAERLAQQALAIDPYDAEAYLVRAIATASLGRLAEAKAATERAVQLNPSSADILNLAATNMSYLGEPEQGAEWCDRSFRLNPSPPYWYYLDCPENYFFTQRYQDVVDGVDRYGAFAEPSASQLVYRAASQAELGSGEAAAATVAELRRRYPAASFEQFLNTGWVFAREQEEQQILAAARKAGVRLCATEEELRAFTPPRRLPECAPKPAG
jgi:TolB-like protein/class 3 adenylate cyclase